MRLHVSRSALAFAASAALAILATPGLVRVDLFAQPRGRSHGGTSSTSRVVSPAVVASWMSRDAPDGTTTLLVLWRGTPGWFSKGGSSASAGGGAGAGGSGSYGYEYMTQGGLTFLMEFDYDRKIVRMLNQDISLKDTNVVFVDFVDSRAGATIVGSRWVDPAPQEQPASADPIAAVIRRAPELFDYLRCDVTLPDPHVQAMMRIVCGQMRP